MSLPHFSGPAYDPRLDYMRLTKQIGRVWASAYGETYRTLDEIARLTGDPQASVSAQLRHLRKPRFGLWTVEKQRRGRGSDGCWEYRITDPEPKSTTQTELFGG